MKSVIYEEGKKLEQTHICTCGGRLNLCWGGAFGINSFVLRCTESNEHSEIMRPVEFGPYDIPGFNLYSLKGRHREMVEKLGEEKAKKLQPYEQIAALTKDQAMKILQTIWPEAPPVEVLKAAIICRQYGLNPLMKHIFLMPFKKHDKKTGEVIRIDWATHIGIKANRLIARRVDRYSYMDNTPRVMTKQEQETIFGAVDPANLWAITKLRDSKGNEAQGYGSWPKDQTVYGADKGNSAANMAFIHSERNALDRLFPGEMPQDVGVIDEQYIEADYKVIQDDTTDKKTIAALAKKSAAKQKVNKVSETAERSPEGGAEGSGENKAAAGSSGADEVTLLSEQGNPEPVIANEAPSNEPVIQGEGFRIPLSWLDETLKRIKWTEETTKSWITGNLKVENKGKLTDMIAHLSQKNADKFARELQERADRVQPELFT